MTSYKAALVGTADALRALVPQVMRLTASQAITEGAKDAISGVSTLDIA